MLGKEITVMHLGESPKRMHDPKSYLVNLFAHECFRSHYVHENEQDDSIFTVVIDFRQEMSKIEDPKVKSHLYKYQKKTKDHTFHYRETKMKIEQDIEKQNTKKEAKEQETIYVSALATQPKDKGKGVL